MLRLRLICWYLIWTVAIAGLLISPLLAAPIPRRGGTLRLGIPTPLTTDPFPVPWDFASRVLASASFQGLTRLDPDGRIWPALAEEWFSEDFRIWRIQLGLENTFHDGTPVTAGDVRRAWESTLRQRGLGFLSWPLGHLKGAAEFVAGSTEQVAGIRQLTDSRLEIELTEPVPLLPEALARPGAWVAKPTETGWLGTGGFQIESWSSESVKLTSVRRGARPYLDRIEAHYYGPAERGNMEFAFEAGTLQGIWDADVGKPIPVWVGLELDPHVFDQPAWVAAVQHAIDPEGLEELRRGAIRLLLRYIGEAEAPPGWQPYRPRKAYRLLRHTNWPEERRLQLVPTALPGHSTQSIARLLEQSITESGCRTELVDEIGTSPDVRVVTVIAEPTLLAQFELPPGFRPSLILYEDTWRAQLAPEVARWQIAGGLPVWESIWLTESPSP